MSARTSDPDEVARVLDELPPSAKLVAYVVAVEDVHSIGEISEASLLPRRTVRYAMTRLEEVGLLEVRQSLTDARRRTCWLTSPEIYRRT